MSVDVLHSTQVPQATTLLTPPPDLPLGYVDWDTPTASNERVIMRSSPANQARIVRDRFVPKRWKPRLASDRVESRDESRPGLGLTDKEKKSKVAPKYPLIHALKDRSQPVSMRVHVRGSPTTLGEEAPRRFLSESVGLTA